MTNTDILTRLRLSIQRALLGMITPDIRLVTAILDQEHKELNINFYFDQEPSENSIENMQEIGTEVAADFYESEILYINENPIEHHYPKPLNALPGVHVYRRKE